MTFVSNARMYAVSPEAEADWKDLIAHAAEDAGASLEYLAYKAPQPLEDLWRRADLGCVQMCGYPIALRIADVVPLASPVPAAPWAGGKAVYRTDLIVRKDAPYRVSPTPSTARSAGPSSIRIRASTHCAITFCPGAATTGRCSTGGPSAISSRRGASSKACWTARSISGRWTPTGIC